jgi:hypothetical protein
MVLRLRDNLSVLPCRSGDHPLLIGRESHRAHPAPVLEFRTRTARLRRVAGDVPDSHRVIVAPRNQRLTVFREKHGLDGSEMRLGRDHAQTHQGTGGQGVAVAIGLRRMK